MSMYSDSPKLKILSHTHSFSPSTPTQKWTKLWVVVHSEVSPLDCFLGYCKKENKWLQDNQAIVKYSLNDFTVSLVSTKKHDKVVRLEFPSISMELCFDSQTKLDHYYQLLLGVTSKCCDVMHTHYKVLIYSTIISYFG